MNFTVRAICRPARSAQLGAVMASVALLFAAAVHGETAAERKGLAIATQMDARDRGWQDQSADLVMILRDARGREARRELRVRSLEVANDGDKSLTIFDSPADVKGTAFLSYTHALKPDDQWLYLPALKRTKRISSANKSGPFMGSQFAYEDLTSQEVQKYRYRWLREERLAGRAADVIERIPAYKHSGYRRQVVWVDRAWLRAVKIEFFDRKNALLKTLTVSAMKGYLRQPYYRPGKMVMQNHQNGKSTELVWRNYAFRSGLSAALFRKNALARAR